MFIVIKVYKNMTKTLEVQKNFDISNLMNVICTAVRYAFVQNLLQPYYSIIYKPEHVAVFRSSISVFLKLCQTAAR
jgi:hypothetical protein